MDLVWIVCALLALLAFIATLRLSIPGLPWRAAYPLLRLITNPNWLVPYIVVMGLALGLMIQGSLSPWPPEAMAQLSARWGRWAGACGLLVVLTVDLWMLWTAGVLARRYVPSGGRPLPAAIHWLNLGFGGFFLLAVGLLGR